MKSPLYIAASAFSRPEAALPFELDQEENVPNVRTALSHDYLLETYNVDPYSAPKALVETPTTLGARAAELACADCKISPSQLGLILGATSTPLQTIPVESQRIGKELQVKIPAYDVNVGGADFALQVETLMSWKEERVPDYALGVSTHIPTSRLHYHKLSASVLAFSDGGGAFVVSKKESPWRIVCAKTRVFPSRSGDFSIPLYGHLSLKDGLDAEFFLPALQELFGSMKTDVSPDAIFIESQLSPDVHAQLRTKIGSGTWQTYWSECGNMLGATPIASLALFEKEQNQVEKGQQIVVLQSGIGLSVGAVVLEKAV